jgi:3-(3-hydroxy-phenyl)propionate hydroxylase
MGDDVWRLDYQMDPGSDPDYVSRRDVAEARLRAHLGHREFELVWVGPYSYRAHLLDDFRHGRVFFVGDAAHVVGPFGARGGNSGIQDAFNLGWKLALVLKGLAPERLLDTYSAERHAAARENLEVTSRTERFLSPQSPAERLLRRAVLGLAREHAFARPLVNSGRLSVANPYPDSPAVTDAGWSLQNVPITLPGGGRANLVELARQVDTAFIGILYQPTRGHELAEFARIEATGLPFRFFVCGPGGIGDPEGKLKTVLRAAPDTFALVRPDLYLAALLRHATAPQAEAALRKALCL